MSGGDEHVSSMGLTRQEGFSDSDDYISIESGKVTKVTHIAELAKSTYNVRIAQLTTYSCVYLPQN